MSMMIVGNPHTIAMVEDVYRNQESIGLVAARRAELPVRGPQDLFSIGTIARIEKLTRMADGQAALLVRGQLRFRLLKVVQVNPYPKAQVEPLEDRLPADGARLEMLATDIRKLWGQMMELRPELSAIKELLEITADPGPLADVIAPDIGFSLEETQALLETVDLELRLSLLAELLTRQVAALETDSRH